MAFAREANKTTLERSDNGEREEWEKRVTTTIQGRTAGQLSLAQEVGGLLGRFFFALLVVRIVSRRALLQVFLVPGLIIVPAVFVSAPLDFPIVLSVSGWHVSVLHIGIFVAGLLTGAQSSYWGNYLPAVYPVHLRGTGESVAINLGGRMIGTSFAALTSILSSVMTGTDDPTRVAYAATVVAAGAYIINLIASFALPEPPLQPPEE